MTRTSPPQYAFNSGEIDPLLFRRPDFQKFQTGLAACCGFLPLRQGAFTRAPGTIYRGTTRNNAKARRIPFEFAQNDALSLEFTDLKMRVWRYGALVTTDGVTPYELDTPFPESSLDSLDWVQSADVIYITDGLRPIQKLSRFALNNWTIGDFTLDTGPFRVQNLDETLTVSPSAATGTIALTASAALFTADHVGGLFQLEPVDITGIPIWTGNTTVAVGDKMIYDSNVYQVAAGTNTGVNPPIHTEGTRVYDKTNGITWTFVSDLVGVVRITAVTSGTSATADVIKTIPDPCVTSASYRWSEGAWSAKYGYPKALEIYDQRLVAAGTPTEPRTIWFSGIGDYTDFAPGTATDSAFAYAIAGDSSVNSILRLKRSGLGLAVFCLGEENMTSKYRSIYTGPTAINPTNTIFTLASTIGTSGARPINPNGNPIFIAKDKTRVFQITYDLSSDRNQSVQLSLPSEHLGAALFEEIVYQSAPLGLAWLRMGDGTLTVMLQDTQQQVLGWARVPVAGGSVESFDVTASADGSYDILNLVVARTVNGATVRYVEELALVYGVLIGQQSIFEAVHLYAAEQFTPGADTDTFTVSHLVGESVYAWTSVGSYGPLTVAADGTVTLPTAVPAGGSCTIGLFDDTHYAELLDIQAAAPGGSTIGRRKRLQSGTGIAVHRTADGTVRTVERELGQPDRIGASQPLIRRSVASVATEAFSGVGRIEAYGGEAEEVALQFQPVGGAPMTIAAVIPIIEEAGR